VVSCYDNGESTIQNIDLQTYESEEVVKLKHKHTNICLKSSFSDPNTVYTLGFDYKVIQWNLNDIANKSQSRNIIEQLTQHQGNNKGMEFNPPFGYSLLTYKDKATSSENILVGLGNGSLLRFKRKKL